MRTVRDQERAGIMIVVISILGAAVTVSRFVVLWYLWAWLAVSVGLPPLDTTWKFVAVVWLQEWLLYRDTTAYKTKEGHDDHGKQVSRLCLYLFGHWAIMMPIAYCISLKLAE